MIRSEMPAAPTQLPRGEELLRAIFDGAMDAILLADDQGNWINVNAAAGELFGAPAQELIGRNVRDFAHANAADVAAVWQKFLELGLLRGQFPIVRADGTRRLTDFSARANILPGLHLSILRDITDNERAEAALRESRYFLEEAQAVAHIGSWVSSLDMPGSLYWSNECYRIFGVPEGSAIDVKSFFDRVHPDDRATVEQAVEAAIARDARYELEHRIVRADGTMRWVYERAVIERDQDRKPVRMIGVVQDITSRRKALDELRASEQRHRRIVETTSEGVFTIAADTSTTFVNQRMAEMLGCRVDQVLGRSICQFLDGGQTTLLEQQLKEQRPSLSGQFELQLKHAGRNAVWASLNVNALLDQAGRYEGALGMATDISERKRSEELRGRLVAIVESSDDAILSEDLQGMLTGWSQGAQRLFGYTADEAIGQPTSMLTPGDRAHESSEILARIRRGESMHHFETVRLRRDGTPVDVSLTISPIKDPSRQIIGASIIQRDLTERRKREQTLRQVEDQLRQAQKMEAIGLLAGGVAHDFNNILSVILSYASLIHDSTSPGDPLRDDISEVRRAGERAADLTRQLLAFSRRQMLQPEVLDLNSVLRGMDKMFRRLLGEDIELSLSLSPDLGMTLADRGQIEQVVMNLAVNARDAMPNGGRLSIAAGNAELHRAPDRVGFGAVGGPCVALTVSDTGFGMDEATCSHIFEPFFTTKDIGKGTGLGLSTVLGIVQQSGGQISVYSQLGQGTTFEIYLPRTAARAEPILAQPAPATLQGLETILLVEDDEQVRTLARSVLRRHGYDVLTAANGGEALLICEAHAARIDVVVTDVVMPLMSGKQLVDRLVVSRPGIRVLFMSGYNDDAIVHHGVLEAGINFLQKPLTPEALTRKVREVLDAEAPLNALST